MGHLRRRRVVPKDARRGFGHSEEGRPRYGKAAPRAEGKDSTAFDGGEGQEAEEFDKVGDQEVAGVEEAAPLPSRVGGLPPASPTAGGEEAPRGSADHDDERRPLV